MNNLAQNYKENAENRPKQKKTSKVATNKMTIVMWRLFHASHVMHMGFMLYRLRRDFGFTVWDCANFTGIPYKKVESFLKAIEDILDSGVLKRLVKMDFVEEEDKWRALPQRYSQTEQGYFIPKSKEWYASHKTRTRIPIFKLGTETEAELDKYLKKYGLIEDNNKKSEPKV